MGRNVADMHDELRLRRTMKLFDDFRAYTTGGDFSSVTEGSATVAAGDGVGGILTLSTIDSTTNRQVYIKTTNKIFLYQANTPIIAEAFIKYSEGNTNKANIGFGFCSSVTAGTLADTTGEPVSTYSGAMIYKVPGALVWKTNSSIGTTQTTNTSDTTVTQGAFTRLRIEINPISSTIAEVTYWVDGVQLKTAGGRPGQTSIKDQVTYTGTAAMNAFLGLKNGSTTAEVLTCDYFAGEELRALFL